MSSIYKKGRDGYFYYQTYVYNPESNKKDKRIYHSLGTKNLSEAKLKQSELDAKYERGEDIEKIHNVFYKKTSFISLVFFFFLFVIILLYKNAIPKNIDYDMDELSSYGNLTLEKNAIDTSLASNINLSSLEAKKSENKMNHMDIDSSIQTSKISLPDYTIERITVLSDAFNQGKIYATVDSSSSKESLLALCNEIRIKYEEFSNLILCLYSNNAEGRKIAQGKSEFKRTEGYKRYWLAMYTYNSVEGEYFDSNPSGYLGGH